MKVAITDLKDYNEGILRYEWLSLEEVSTIDELSASISQFLNKRSGETKELHEEWFISDYESFTDLGEYPSLEELEQGINLSMEYGWEAVKAYYDNCQSFDDFEEAYNGIHDSEEDFASDIAEDLYSAEQLGVLSIYIDWEKLARDLFINDYFSEKLGNYQIAVFRRL